MCVDTSLPSELLSVMVLLGGMFSCLSVSRQMLGVGPPVLILLFVVTVLNSLFVL